VCILQEQGMRSFLVPRVTEAAGTYARCFYVMGFTRFKVTNPSLQESLTPYITFSNNNTKKEKRIYKQATVRELYQVS
jgi:hypothetical protein